jgi:hypothetical protein
MRSCVPVQSKSLRKITDRMHRRPLRDSDIRAALRDKLRSIHADEPDTAIIDELSLSQGEARVDLAVINGSFSGYEIKSDRDTFIRLPNQLAVYELCFNTLTIVVGSRHVAACKDSVPIWWGIWEAVRLPDETVELKERRQPRNNRRISPEQVVQLLWRDEVLEVLKRRNISVRAKATRPELWNTLTKSSSPQELFQTVRECLRARGDWRSGPTPFRGDGLCQSVAKSERSHMNRRWLLSELSQNRPN